MEIEFLADGTVKVRYAIGKPFTLPHGSWVYKETKLIIIYENESGTEVTFNMIRTEFGWNSDASADIISEPVLNHVTRTAAEIIGEWKFVFKTEGMYTIRFTSTYTV